MSLSVLRAVLWTDPAIIVLTVFFGSLNLIVSLFDTNGRKQILLARAWARGILAASGVKVQTEGLDNIDPNGSYVFAGNHCSYMDTPVILANIPVQFRFLAKSELFKIPFLGSHLRQAGHIPVPRSNPREAIKTMNEAGRTIRDRGISVLIFPEGGRSKDGLQSFREGAAYIAIKAGAPVVPIAITGTSAIVPVGSAIVRPGPVRLRVGAPISTAGLTLQALGKLTQQMHEAVAALLEGAREGTAAR